MIVDEVNAVCSVHYGSCGLSSWTALLYVFFFLKPQQQMQEMSFFSRLQDLMVHALELSLIIPQTRFQIYRTVFCIIK